MFIKKNRPGYFKMYSLCDLLCKNEIFESDKPCFIYYNRYVQHYVSYKSVFNSVTDIIAKTDNYFRNSFIGLVYHEISPAIIVVMLSVIQQNSAFVFLDSTSTNMNEKYTKMKISAVIIEQNSPLISWIKIIFPFAGYFKKITVLDVTFELWKCHSNTNMNVKHNDFVFAVCTSGSTGQPKIVKVTHNSFVPNILHLRDVYAVKRDDVFFTTAPLTFDPSIVDIFLTLISGASLLILSKEITIHPEQLFNYMFTNGPNGVTIFYTTPSLLRRWDDNIIKRLNGTTLRTLSLGGEPCPPLDVINRWDIMTKIKVYNLYGITEVSCWASICCVNELTTENNIPLGIPIKETVLQVRDKTGTVILNGCGEMFIGSEIRICCIDGETIDESRVNCFRATGDIVEIKGSDYYFVGRKDRVVKIYGRQIDLSAIEIASLKLEEVTHSCCFYLSKGTKIILMVQAKMRNNSTDKDRVIRSMKQLILEQFSIVLDDIVVVSEIPLNKHGKISATNCELTYRTIANKEKFRQHDRETYFYSLWNKYTTEDDPNSSFTKFGNDSVKAVQFVSEYSQIYGSINPELISALLVGKSARHCYSLLENNLSSSGILLSSEKRSISHESLNLPSKRTLEPDINLSIVEGCDRNENVILWKCRGVEKRLITTNDERLPVLQNISVYWKFDLEKCIDSSPLLLELNGKKMVVVCGSHSGKLIAVDVISSKILSTCTLSNRIESSPCCSSDGKRIYLGCYDKNLYSVDLYSGKILWNFETMDIVKSGPVVFSRCIYFGSYDHYLYCLTEEGELLWKKNIDDSSIYASVAIYDVYIITATLKGTVVVLDVNGNVVRTYQFGRSIFSNPLSLPDLNAFCIADVSGTLYCCCVNVKNVLWKYSVGGNIFSSLAVVKPEIVNNSVKIIFGCYDHHLYCLSISKHDAQLEWKSDLGSPIYATPFTCHEYVISATIRGTVYISNVVNGNVLSVFNAGGEIFSSPILHEDYVLFGCRDDNLYCLKLNK